jgi:hypothetical protein
MRRRRQRRGLHETPYCSRFRGRGDGAGGRCLNRRASRRLRRRRGARHVADRVLVQLQQPDTRCLRLQRWHRWRLGLSRVRPLRRRHPDLGRCPDRFLLPHHSGGGAGAGHSSIDITSWTIAPGSAGPETFFASGTETDSFRGMTQTSTFTNEDTGIPATPGQLRHQSDPRLLGTGHRVPSSGRVPAREVAQTLGRLDRLSFWSANTAAGAAGRGGAAAAQPVVARHSWGRSWRAQINLICVPQRMNGKGTMAACTHAQLDDMHRARG